jgi:hypothetical protein
MWEIIHLKSNGKYFLDNKLGKLVKNILLILGKLVIYLLFLTTKYDLCY